MLKILLQRTRLPLSLSLFFFSLSLSLSRLPPFVVKVGYIMRLDGAKALLDARVEACSRELPWSFC